MLVNLYLATVILSAASTLYVSVALREHIGSPATWKEYAVHVLKGLWYTGVPVVNLMPVAAASVVLFLPKFTAESIARLKAKK